MSTIDIIFLNAHARAHSVITLNNTAITPLRKHIAVRATINVTRGEVLNKTTTTKIKRNLNREQIAKSTAILEAAKNNSYRGIVLESNLFKLFTKILTNRIVALTDHLIPEEQMGFHKGRSTLQAITNLMGSIEEALRHPKGKLYVLFINYRKAFDMINRQKLMHKKENSLGKNHYLTNTIRKIMESNKIIIDNNLNMSEPLTQTNGVLQGDLISPHLFNLMTANVVTAICKGEKGTLYMYADDMALAAKNPAELQERINHLAKWAETNGMEINEKKTVIKVFRKGGKVPKNDTITHKTANLRIVNEYKYQGITFQTRSTCFSIHAREKAAAATRAIRDIKHLQALSLETALKLFFAKVLPIITYGIQILWQHLKKRELEMWEKVKATFLKRALRVSRYTPSRLVYLLAREPFLIEDIRLRQCLPSTDAYQELLRERTEKRHQVGEEFYGTGAIIDRNWSLPNQLLLHVVTQLAVQGYHHKECETSYHKVNDKCVCKQCKKFFGQYHIMCAEITKSIIEYA
ncbi:hypothetical protein C0J52_17327 [Blattella germanica]|nr:hypothetical protein C0J52_17327 [Blattella germanica]